MTKRRWVWALVQVVGGILLISMTIPSLGPAIRLARSDGTPGTFTAREQTCVQHPGHQSCTWTGDFRSTTGRVRHPSIALFGWDRPGLSAGGRVRAVDVGRVNAVYGPDASGEWLLLGSFVVAGLILVLGPIASPLLARTRSTTRARIFAVRKN